MNRVCMLVIAFLVAPVLCLAAEKKVISATLKAPSPEQKSVVLDARVAKGELIDINSASEKQLNAIAGVGPEYSERIIAGRPYSTQDQLVTRKIIPRELYESIKNQIIAKQAY